MQKVVLGLEWDFKFNFMIMKYTFSCVPHVLICIICDSFEVKTENDFSKNST